MQAEPHVKLTGEDGVADRAAPQHAGVTGLRVPVRQLADCAGHLNQCGFVVEVSQCEWRSSHEGAVARGAATEFV